MSRQRGRLLEARLAFQLWHFVLLVEEELLHLTPPVEEEPCHLLVVEGEWRLRLMAQEELVAYRLQLEEVQPLCSILLGEEEERLRSKAREVGVV